MIRNNIFSSGHDTKQISIMTRKELNALLNIIIKLMR